MSGGLSEADLRAVREAWDALQVANSAADTEAMLRYMTDDHVSLDPRLAGPIRGVEAWRKWAESLEVSDVDLDVEVEEVSGSGDLAVVVWTAAGSWTEGGEKSSTSAKGLSLFRRGLDGSWHWSHNAWNANP